MTKLNSNTSPFLISGAKISNDRLNPLERKNARNSGKKIDKSTLINLCCEKLTLDEIAKRLDASKIYISKKIELILRKNPNLFDLSQCIGDGIEEQIREILFSANTTNLKEIIRLCIDIADESIIRIVRGKIIGEVKKNGDM